MKKIYLLIILGLLSLGLSNVVNAQTTIYEENFGSPSANTNVNSYTGWSNATVTYIGEGNVDVRSSNASSTARYPEASGSGNVMINNTSKKLTVSGINTASYTDLKLSLGLRKGTNAEDGSSFVIEYSTDGDNFTALTKESLPTGSGTVNWHYISTTSAIPSSSTLHLRFSSTSSVEFRVDDLKLTGTLNVSTPTVTIAGITNNEIEFDAVPVGNTNVTETFTVNAVNLTDDVSLVISGTNADSFEVSPTSISKGTGTVTDQTITVTYKPSSSDIESVSAILTLSSTGAASVTIDLSGSTALGVPVATSATAVEETSFSANWNALPGATSYLLDVYTKTGGASVELVVDGGFENGDFSSWTMAGDNNTIGTASPNGGSYYFSKTGTGTSRIEQNVTVEIGKTYILSFWYNNYDASNTNGIKNYSLLDPNVATSYVEGGTPAALAAASSWTKYEKEFTATTTTVKISIRAYQVCDIDDISIIEKDPTTLTHVPGSPFSVTGTTHPITGLSASTDYYYTVKAVAGSGSIVSDESNEVKVTTKDSGVNIEEKEIDGVVVYKEGNNIVVKSEAASNISIYSVSGKLVYSKDSEGDVVTIPLNKGVYVVKVGDKATKVVL